MDITVFLQQVGACSSGVGFEAGSRCSKRCHSESTGWEAVLFVEFIQIARIYRLDNSC